MYCPKFLFRYESIWGHHAGNQVQSYNSHKNDPYLPGILIEVWEWLDSRYYMPSIPGLCLEPGLFLE